MPAPDLDTIANLAKQRGCVPRPEIYGGLRSRGTTAAGEELCATCERRGGRRWCAPHDIVGIDSAIIQARQVWATSGHEASFTDPLVECTNCNHRFRLDKLDDPHQCPDCSTRDSFTEPKAFNLMLKTFLGPVEDDAGLAYLRPETAQGIFINYENVRRTARLRLPFGIAQIGKSFRNEILRSSCSAPVSSEQMEMEFFCRPEEAESWHRHWLDARMQWYLGLGCTDWIRLRAYRPGGLAHYGGDERRGVPVPWGWDELEGSPTGRTSICGPTPRRTGSTCAYYARPGGGRALPM
jgi:glycyl-tRNA synthetase